MAKSKLKSKRRNKNSARPYRKISLTKYKKVLKALNEGKDGAFIVGLFDDPTWR